MDEPCPQVDNWCEEGVTEMEGIFTSITTGFDIRAGLRPDGTIVAWTGCGFPFSPPPPSGPFQRLVAGYRDACGIRPDGSIECFGENLYGKHDFPPGVYVDVASFETMACALREDGRVTCCGRFTNADGIPIPLPP